MVAGGIAAGRICWIRVSGVVCLTLVVSHQGLGETFVMSLMLMKVIKWIDNHNLCG